jgi:hypothetical protein
MHHCFGKTGECPWYFAIAPRTHSLAHRKPRAPCSALCYVGPRISLCLRCVAWAPSENGPAACAKARFADAGELIKFLKQLMQGATQQKETYLMRESVSCFCRQNWRWVMLERQTAFLKTGCFWKTNLCASDTPKGCLFNYHTHRRVQQLLGDKWKVNILVLKWILGKIICDGSIKLSLTKMCATLIKNCSP